MVNSLPTIYGVDRFGISGFRFRRCSPPLLPISKFCEIRKVLATNSSVTLLDLMVEPSYQIYNVDLLGFFWSSCIVIPTLLCNSKGFLNPVHTFQIRRSRGFAFPPEQILRLQHFWCGVLSPCGHRPHQL